MATTKVVKDGLKEMKQVGKSGKRAAKQVTKEMKWATKAEIGSAKKSSAERLASATDHADAVARQLTGAYYPTPATQALSTVAAFSVLSALHGSRSLADWILSRLKGTEARYHIYFCVQNNTARFPSSASAGVWTRNMQFMHLNRHGVISSSSGAYVLLCFASARVVVVMPLLGSTAFLSWWIGHRLFRYSKFLGTPWHEFRFLAALASA